MKIVTSPKRVGKAVVVDRRLYLTDAGKLVEPGDSDASLLWAKKGQKVDSVEAERVGYAPKTARKRTASKSKSA